MRNIGNIFKTYRKKEGITQEDVCKYVGISIGHYSNIERNSKIPSVDVFFKICKILKINLNVFEDCDDVLYEEMDLSKAYNLSEEDTEFIKDMTQAMAKGLAKRSKNKNK